MKFERRVRVGIRLKLFGFLLPIAFLLVGSVTWTVTEVTKDTLRRDLLQRGAAISRVVALSAGHSLLANDPLGLDRLVSETKASDPDIAFVSIRDTSDIVVAHDRVTERGKPFRPVPPLLSRGTFGDTRADEVNRDGRRIIEYTSPISFAGRRVGIASLGLSMEGLATAQRSIQQRIFAAAAVILVAAFFGTMLLSSFITTPVKRLHQGVLSLAGSETFQPVAARSSDELGALTRNFNRMAEVNIAQKTALQKKAVQLEEAYISMVRVIAASLDARDPYTMGHSTRVARMACALGRCLEMDEAELSNLEREAIFHDIGKIQTPDDVLLKGERLSRAEEEQMKSHAVDGTEILRMAPFLQRYIPVVRAHHEWYNGEGYPDGIKGDEIPLHAQLIALADAFDAMTTDRPYRQALSTEEAIDEILQFRGTQFAPELADAFAKMMREMPPMDETVLKSMAL
ncbi:HD domain-containing phosphohydrolase [Candidatus Deferrimicrobium sp.]|uniref:HD domain-containing phosphohydrolase n=1 Tax=Candidatus Deferrimicrobium sp. TaxID=3060586 RepID=UPI002ECFC0FF